MDAAKKTAIEKRIVIGLGGLFVVAFVLGPVRHLGLFSRPAPATGQAAPDVEKVNVSKPVTVMLQEGWQRIQDRSTVEPTPGPADESLYTAQQLRDPMQSLIPSADASLDQYAAVLATPPAPAKPATPPPILRIQGMMWGGTEPKAVINGKVYGVEDEVSGVRILAIDERGVTVLHNGMRLSYSSSSMTPRGLDGSMTAQAQ